MTTLQWSESMGVDMAQMDATHQESVQLLQAVQGADDARLMAAWEQLLAHTEAHFAAEDRWMQATRFAAGNCHTTQHQQVLTIMRDGTERGSALLELEGDGRRVTNECELTETRRASISGVQRRLKIGYNRAARLIEEMERIGIVSAQETNGNREVLAPPPPGD